MRCADFADRSVYPDVKSYFSDLARVFQEEITELAAAGCRYLQIDEIAIPLLCDPGIRAKVERVGADPDALVDLYIDAINQAVSACPPDVVVGVHMCRGNLRGHYLGEGSYESVAERFFAGIHANHFLLEYDTPRAGDFKPLRFVPKTRASCSGSSAARPPCSRARMACAAAWRTPPNTWISTGWRSVRNADSPAPPRAIR